jgi:DnaJ-class molecular chaperone
MASAVWLFDKWFEEREERILADIGAPEENQSKVEKWLENAYMLGKLHQNQDRCEVCPLCDGEGKVKNKALPVQMHEDQPTHQKVECYHCRGVGKVLKKEE